MLALEDASLERHAAALKKRRIKILGEKVESRAMHRRLLALGFDLFQGYFFARPETYKSQKIAPNKLLMLELLARVNEPNVTPKDLSSIMRSDVSMSITVLRWANGSFYGLRRPVESIERAIIVLGLQTIRNWASLLVLSRMGAKPTELISMLLIRARAGELLASAAERPNPAAFFTVGLLSALDVVLEMDIAQALQHMSLTVAQKAALIEHTGEFSSPLNAVMAMERGDVGAAQCFDLTFEQINECYLSAISWADSVPKPAP